MKIPAPLGAPHRPAVGNFKGPLYSGNVVPNKRKEMAAALLADAAIFKASGKRDAAVIALRAKFSESKADVDAIFANDNIKVVCRPMRS